VDYFKLFFTAFGQSHTHDIHSHTHIFVFHIKMSDVRGKHNYLKQPTAAHPILVKGPSLFIAPDTFLI